MARFTTHDQIIEALSVNDRSQKLYFTKRLANAAAVNVPNTFWNAEGMPAQGTYPAAGMGSAVVTTSATTGALPYTNPGGGREMFALGATATGIPSVNDRGLLLLCDRIAHANINHNQGTASFSPVIDGTSRLAAGEGGMILMEVTTAFSAASNTRTFTYTNQAGTAGRTTGNIVTVASSLVGRVPYADFLWVPLQSGDTGCRSIESTTLVSGTATGAHSVCIVNPIGAWIIIPNGSFMSTRDFVLEVPSLPLIRDNACLFWLMVHTVATNIGIAGFVKIAEN